MTVAAAATFAQVIPALLVAGLLGPLLLSGFKVQYPERGLFASYVTGALIAEAVCLWSVGTDSPLPTGMRYVVFLGTGFTVFGILIFVGVYARKTAAEKSEADSEWRASKERRTERRRVRLAKRSVPVRRVDAKRPEDETPTGC